MVLKNGKIGSHFLWYQNIERFSQGHVTGKKKEIPSLNTVIL